MEMLDVGSQEFACPHCGVRLTRPSAPEGIEGPCPRCGFHIRVPAVPRAVTVFHSIPAIPAAPPSAPPSGSEAVRLGVGDSRPAGGRRPRFTGSKASPSALPPGLRPLDAGAGSLRRSGKAGRRRIFILLACVLAAGAAGALLRAPRPAPTPAPLPVAGQEAPAPAPAEEEDYQQVISSGERKEIDPQAVSAEIEQIGNAVSGSQGDTSSPGWRGNEVQESRAASNSRWKTNSLGK